jgi:RNA polymerase sigma factor (sigma-70 family)
VADPAAYLHGIVVNLSRSSIRRTVMARRRRPPASSVSRAADDGAERSATRSAVLAALAGLPRRQREAVVLRFYRDLSEAEIAAAMGVSAGSVKVNLHRALASLSERMEDLR